MPAHAAPVTPSTIVVAVDIGKTTAAVSATDAARHRLFGPVDIAMTRSDLTALVDRLTECFPLSPQFKIGIEAAGHYHHPMLDYPSWPPEWEVLELNPARVSEQRRVQGRRRIKTDAIDLEAITDLLLAVQGQPVHSRDLVVGELAAWATAAAESPPVPRRRTNSSANSTEPSPA